MVSVGTCPHIYVGLVLVHLAVKALALTLEKQKTNKIKYSGLVSYERQTSQRSLRVSKSPVLAAE